jgi:hypothetical protein
VRLVDAWSKRTASDFAVACVRRARDRAAAALASVGSAATAADVVRIDEPARLAARLETARPEAPGPAGDVVGYAAETAGYAASGLESGDPAWASCVAYVSAFLAGFEACGDPSRARNDPAYVEERRWQARWLVERLGLPFE